MRRRPMLHIGSTFFFRYEMVGYLLLITFLMSGVTAGAQTRKELEKKRDNLLRQIEHTNTLINRTRKKKKLTVHDLATIEQQIKQRTALIRLLQKETATLTSRSEVLQDSITLLEGEILQTKKQYESLLRRAYINKMTRHPYQFFLSAGTISEGFQNMIYLRQIKRHITEKYHQLTTQHQTLQAKHRDLEQVFTQKKVVLDKSIKQQDQLVSDQRAKERALSNLEKRERELRRQLKKKKKARIRLNDAIERIIFRELEAGRAKEKSGHASPEDLTLSKNFAANRGKLPWPVSHGTITGHFGRQKHKTLKQVYITNNGIDIQTDPGAPVRSIYEGTVAGIASIPGYDRMVVIKQGNYYIVYSRLKDITVSKGQHIPRGTKVGVLTSDGEHAGLLHLEVWKGKTKLNPEKWIK